MIMSTVQIGLSNEVVFQPSLIEGASSGHINVNKPFTTAGFAYGWEDVTRGFVLHPPPFDCNYASVYNPKKFVLPGSFESVTPELPF